jgi:uncharacterized protein involved in exopolysaccharide biosynthesis
MNNDEFTNADLARPRYTTLRDWVAVGFRRRRILLTTFLGVFLGVILVAWLWAANFYESSMQVLVEENRSDPSISPAPNAAVGSGAMVTPDQISSEVALLQGKDMLRAVASTCGLDQHSSHLLSFLRPRDPEKSKEYDLEKATASLSRALDVQAEKTADVIDVSYAHKGDPETPACVLGTLGKLYVEKHVRLIRPAGTSDFFAQEADKYHQLLLDSEARLANFGTQEGVVAPDLERANVAQELVRFQSALHQTQQTIAADQRRISDETVQLKGTPERSATQVVTNSSSILLQNLQADLLAAQVKRTQLLLKYQPTYPLVMEVDEEITETQKAIDDAQKSAYLTQTTDRDPTYEFLREDAARTRADLASQQATARAINASLEAMQIRLVELDQKSVLQAAEVRDSKVNEANYLLYVSKREQGRTSDALDAKNIANVAIAVPPVVPILPAHSPVFVALIGFFLAISTSIAAAFVAEYLDPSFRNPEDVVSTLNIPVLASMPRRVA